MSRPEADPDDFDDVKAYAYSAVDLGARLAFDENFNNNVLRGLLRRRPLLDILRIQDAGLAGRDDPAVIAWAAEQGRILVSHDVSTLTEFAYERVRAGLPMPGLFEQAR